MKSIFITAFACLFATGLCAQPGYFRVTGVAADDTLNVRAEPRASSADIGDLPPDATGIEVLGTDASGAWAEIIWEEGNAWIARRFLTPDTVDQVQGTRLPAGLLCGGTEPFWSLKLGQASAVYSDISGMTFTMPMAGSTVAEGRPDFPVAMQHGGGGNGSLSVVRPIRCSDGMSDRDYPYTLSFILQTTGGRRFLEGCCHLPIDAGSH